MKVKVGCSEFECCGDIHFKTQPGPVAKNAAPRPATELQKPLLTASARVLYIYIYIYVCGNAGKV